MRKIKKRRKRVHLPSSDSDSDSDREEKSRKRKKRKNEQERRGKRRMSGGCKTCTRTHGGRCWFENKMCFNCRETGHMAIKCPKPRKKKPFGKQVGNKADQAKAKREKERKDRMKAMSARQKKGKKKGKKEVRFESSSSEDEVSMLASMEEASEVVLSSSKVYRPELKTKFAGLQEEHSLILDTGTHIDLIDEKFYKSLRSELEDSEVDSMRKIDLSDCGVKVKSAGGTYLDVKGKVFLDMDFGHSLRAGAPFAVVKNLGVPALLGMSSMTRIGMDLCLRKKPYHIKMSDPQNKEKFAYLSMRMLEKYCSLS